MSYDDGRTTRMRTHGNSRFLTNSLPIEYREARDEERMMVCNQVVAAVQGYAEDEGNDHLSVLPEVEEANCNSRYLLMRLTGLGARANLTRLTRLIKQKLGRPVEIIAERLKGPSGQKEYSHVIKFEKVKCQRKAPQQQKRSRCLVCFEYLALTLFVTALMILAILIYRIFGLEFGAKP